MDGEGRQGRKQVLVVEDDDEVREFLCALLQAAGWEALGAANGREALELLRAMHGLPDLILLDLMMPVMTGPQFLAERRGDPALAGVPVVIVSSEYESSHRAEAMGAAGFVAKPIEPQALLTAAEGHRRRA